MIAQGDWYVVKERRSEGELRQMMLAAARKHEECSELEDLFIFGPMPRPEANQGQQGIRGLLHAPQSDSQRPSGKI